MEKIEIDFVLGSQYWEDPHAKMHRRPPVSSLQVPISYDEIGVRFGYLRLAETALYDINGHHLRTFWHWVDERGNRYVPPSKPEWMMTAKR